NTMKNKQKGSIGIVILVVVGGLIGLVLLGVLGTALNLITIPWLKFNKQVQMERDIVSKTYDADNALIQYHWFKERFESIKATESKIKIAKTTVEDFELMAGARKDWTFEDKNEAARLSAILQGLKGHYEDLVAEYNAKAKETDRAIFKDELPLFFDLQAF
ncbi:MAG: hypothetical protein QME51_07730, partial [Planctomycetota bacterium]|nr:hypothetical protein [Planctomycetota bacterium]